MRLERRVTDASIRAPLDRMRRISERLADRLADLPRLIAIDGYEGRGREHPPRTDRVAFLTIRLLIQS